MRILLSVLFSLFALFPAKGQDGHLSMYDAAPIFLNPALTGVFQGDYRIHGQYRTQWKAVNFKPYTSALISADMSYKKWGFGVQINNFRAGEGNFNVLQGLFSAAYYVPLNTGKSHVLSFGLQGGVTQKTLEYQLLSFNNQYTLSNGGGFDQTLVSNEDFGARSQLLPMLNFGAVYYYSKPQSRFNPFVGISLFNLLQPKESFYSFDNRLPLRVNSHIGARINITELLSISPKILLMTQKKFYEQTYALEVAYFMKSSTTYLLAGGIFRSNDAFVATIGARKDNYILKLGYDFNLSSLTPVSSGRGGFELSFTYIHKKVKPTDYKICPRL